MSAFKNAVLILSGICIFAFILLLFVSFFIKQLPTLNNTVRYLRKRIKPHNKGIFNIEEQLRLLEEEYSNEISAVRFRDTDNSVLGGYCSWFTKTSVMCQEYAYLLITTRDDFRLQNAFQYSLAHERGHIRHSFLKILLHCHNLCIAHWVDEVLADIAAFQLIHPDWENLSNEAFQQALCSFQNAIQYKIDYIIVSKTGKCLKREEYDDAYCDIYEHDKYKHPSWKNRYVYVSMLQTSSIDEIIQKIERDCKDWLSTLPLRKIIKAFMNGE